jgi:LuxR family maltose regulon positive regulatory protein
MAGMLQAYLGTIYYECNDLENARRYLEKSIEQGRLWANWETLLPGYIGLARTRNAAGDLSKALSIHAELAELATKTPTNFGISLAQADRAWLLLVNGDPAAAQDWVRTCEIKPGEAIPYLLEANAIYLARFLAALGYVSDALLITAELEAATQSGGRTSRLLEVLLIQALAHQASGDNTLAEDDLNQALALAEQQGFVRTLLDAGPIIHSLLRQVSGDRAGYAHQILEALKPPGERSSRSVHTTQDTGSALMLSRESADSLSEREIEVLRLVAQGYSNQEIAEILVISTNTVKSHVKNILGRLQVSNRTQAAARAREQGLI